MWNNKHALRSRGLIELILLRLFCVRSVVTAGAADSDAAVPSYRRTMLALSH